MSKLLKNSQQTHNVPARYDPLCPQCEEAGFNERRWKRDQFADLHNDDALWAYMIRCSEEFRLQDWERIHDPTFRRLLMMGIFDWDKTDAKLNHTKPAMRFATAMGSRLMSRILEGEDQVQFLACRF